MKVSPDGRVSAKPSGPPRSGRLAAQRHRPRLCREPDGPRRRAGQVRQLDRPAGHGHQPPAGGLRVRPIQLTPSHRSRLRRRSPARPGWNGSGLEGEPVNPASLIRAPGEAAEPASPAGKAEPLRGWPNDHRHQAAPDRPRDLHPLQHLRDHVPGRARSRTIRRNYVVDAAKCNWCNACISPCPTGSIDNYRQMPRAQAYSGRRAVGLGRPAGRTEPAEQLSTAAAGAAMAEEAADRHAPQPATADAAGTEAAFNSAAVRNATVPPWSAAHAYTNLYGPKAAEKSVTATVAGNVRVTEVGRQRLRHPPHRARLRRHALSGAGGPEHRHRAARAPTKPAGRTMRASTASPARATASGRATTTCRSP